MVYRPLNQKQRRALIIIATGMPFGPVAAHSVERTGSWSGKKYQTVRFKSGDIDITPQVYSLSGRNLVKIKWQRWSRVQPDATVELTPDGWAMFEKLTKEKDHGT